MQNLKIIVKTLIITAVFIFTCSPATLVAADKADPYVGAINAGMAGEFKEAARLLDKAGKDRERDTLTEPLKKVASDGVKKKIDPYMAKEIFAAAKHLEAGGQTGPADALKLLSEAVKRRPVYWPALALRGEVLRKTKKYREAIDDFSELIELEPKLAHGYNQRGLALLGEGSFVGAATTDFTRAINIDPDAPGPYNNRGLAYYRKGEAQKAVDDFTKAVKLDPWFTEAFINRGRLHHDTDNFQLAIMDFDKARRLDPTNPEILYLRALSYMSEGLYQRAHRDLARAIKIGPNATIFYTRGLILFIEGKLELAIAAFTSAIEIDKEYSPAYFKRGVTLRKTGDYEGAIRDFTSAIKLKPDYAEAYDNRGVIYLVNLENKIRSCLDWKRACELGSCTNFSLARERGICD